jgi:hypothetical protein
LARKNQETGTGGRGSAPHAAGHAPETHFAVTREVCPTCHQKIRQENRFGIAVSPLKARLIDFIEAHPKVEISDIHTFFGGEQKMRKQTLRSHLHQLRTMMHEATSSLVSETHRADNEVVTIYHIQPKSNGAGGRRK